MAPKFSLWLKVGYTLFVCAILPIYWKQYGPSNFLWFSDIALFLTVPALWMESRLLVSTITVSVVLFELAWNVDFFVRLITGRELIGLSRYMFESRIKLPVRALSLFHVFLPSMLLWMIYRLGYDSRALLLQTIVAWIVLPATYALTKPEANINWVYGFGRRRQTPFPALVHLVLLMIVFPLLVYLPSHLILQKVFGD